MKKYIIIIIALIVIIALDIFAFAICDVDLKKDIIYNTMFSDKQSFDNADIETTYTDGKTTSLLVIDKSNENKISEYAKVQHLSIGKSNKVYSYINDGMQVYTLSISDVDKTDLSKFNKNKLHSLYLQNTSIDETSILSELKNLEVLSMNNVHFNNLSCLKESSIERLYIYGCDITDIFDIASITTLKELVIDNCDIMDASLLSQCEKLESLTIRNTKIRDVQFISQLSELTNIDLSYNNLTGEIDLSSLSKVRTLNLSNNKITKVKLNNLIQMSIVNISYNNITTFDDDFYKQLEELKNIDTFYQLNIYGNILDDCSKIKGNDVVQFIDNKGVYYSYEEYEKYVKALKNVILKYTNKNWNDEKNAISVYYYIARNVKYDHSLADSIENESSSNRGHTAYGALVNKMAVCDGLSYAYQDIMRQIGIECLVYHGDWDTASDGAGHAWNIIKLNNKYYHCDITWELGFAVHLEGEVKYFGQSDDMLIDKNYLLIDKNAPKCPDAMDSSYINHIVVEISKD